jgi:hypothetical protein
LSHPALAWFNRWWEDSLLGRFSNLTEEML